MTRDEAVQELLDVKRSLERRGADYLDAQEEVYERYRPSFQPGEVSSISPSEVGRFLEYKNNHHWTGLARSKGRITSDVEALREGLSILVDENRPLDSRFTKAHEMVHGMGTAIATAILHVAYPGKYGVWNNTSEGGMKRLDLWPDFEHGATVGEKYEEVNGILNRLAADLSTDLWALDGFWHWHQKLGEEDESDSEESVDEQRFGLEEHLQDFLRDNWEETKVLGPEWELFEDETGPNAGYEYQTGVGQIDLLAEHKSENRWLVVELKREQSSDKAVGQVLRYIGAVHRELAEEGDEIEGLIIAQEATEKLRYALEKLDFVSFRRYEVDFRLLPDEG